MFLINFNQWKCACVGTNNLVISCLVLIRLCYNFLGPVYRLATGWTIQCSNSGKGKRFFSYRKRPDRLWITMSRAIILDPSVSSWYVTGWTVPFACFASSARHCNPLLRYHTRTLNCAIPVV